MILLGKYNFFKAELPRNFISCSHPLLLEPPSNIATLYNFGYLPHSQKREVEYNDENVVKMAAFAVCIMIQKLNEAAEFYKKNHCKTANFNRTFAFFDNMDIA